MDGSLKLKIAETPPLIHVVKNASKNAPESWAALGVGPGELLLDSRRALIHPAADWMAVADLHLGYEAARRRQGALIPDHAGKILEAALASLIHDHQPHTLIIAGDIMDARGSLPETLEILDRLAARVSRLVLVRGNHDHLLPDQIAGAEVVDHHCEGRFFFHHGHQSTRAAAKLASLGQPPPEGWVEVTGHIHPAARFRDGAGLRVKLPVLARHSIPQGEGPARTRLVLPALSPWSGGCDWQPVEGDEVWACLEGRPPKLLPPGQIRRTFPEHRKPRRRSSGAATASTS
jgi:metallophosphoesterase superfamily enzyme